MGKLVLNKEYIGTICDLGCNGEGIVKMENYPIFIPFALVGEEITFKIVHLTKNYGFGEIVKINKESEGRIKPKCPYFKKCGGCDIQHMNRELQLKFKKQQVENNLAKITGLNIKVDDTVSLNEFEYRNKLALPFGYIKGSNRVVLGFFEKKSHKCVAMNWCPLHGEWHQKLIKVVTTWATDNKISVYDEKTGKGLLRHLVCRYIDTLSCVLVINGDKIPYLDDLANRLKKEFKNFVIYISPNKKNTNVIFGDTIKLVYGKEVKQNIDGLKINISPLSFLQVNDKVKNAIYNKVCDYMSNFDGDIVELYSGVGILTAQLANRLTKAKITAVEIVPEATNDANKLMADIGFSDRVTNITEDAEKYMEKISLTDKKYALVLDPPRKGCSENVIKGVLKAPFEKIAYISCNPATLARDLKMLVEKYEVVSLTPYDMFPQTKHVETVVLLKNK